MIKVSYDGYEKFKEQYGHLFTTIAYSHYLLRMEYRFTGKMMPDAPSYVNLNSGVMIHAQSPQSMRLNQGFPCSLEVQFLEIMKEKDGAGRKLEFLVQEMFRETNTIGSKASDVGISKDVVSIKHALEQVRELIQNVE